MNLWLYRRVPSVEVRQCHRCRRYLLQECRRPDTLQSLSAKRRFVKTLVCGTKRPAAPAANCEGPRPAEPRPPRSPPRKFRRVALLLRLLRASQESEFETKHLAAAS